jgi:hypothetical protein
MKRICLGIFGMIRTKLDIRAFAKFRNLLPDCEIDIFITTCNKFCELDVEDVHHNLDLITEDLYKVFKGCNVFTNVYNYDPQCYIQKVKSLKYNQFCKITNLFPYRIISMHDSVSRLSKDIIEHIEKTQTKYDNIIFTRFDMFKNIKSFGDILRTTNVNNIYLYRNPRFYDNELAEDRAIILCTRGVELLQNLYNSHALLNLNEEDFWSENIIKTYLKQFDDVNLLIQNGVIINITIIQYEKYTDHFISKQNEFINKLI